MAKQQKLNKNLVAFLTVMGIVLSVAVVAIATHQKAQRDPATYAKAAQDKEKAGDPQRAIELYKQAFTVNKEVKYLAEASRCAWDIGEVGAALLYLETAHNTRPDDIEILNQLLERNWELKDYTRRWVELRDYSARMLTLQPDHALALLCQAVALDKLVAEDATYAQKSADSLAKAVEKSPNDPRVVETRAMLELEAFRKAIAALGVVSMPVEQFNDQAREYRERAAGYLADGLKAHPGHARLATAYAQILADLGRPDEAEQSIDQAADANPSDPELQVARARYLLGRSAEKGADVERRKSLVARAVTSINRALEADPTFYDAHLLLGMAKTRDPAPGEGDAADAKRYEAAIAVYENALKVTVGARSLRALLASNGRSLLMFEGFRAARLLQLNRSLDAAGQAAALEKVRSFLKAAQVEKKDEPLTLIMQGEVAIAEGNNRAAIQSFARAEEKTRTDPALQQFNLIGNEYLAGLYRTEGEPGLALQHADRALSLYASLGGIQPLNLLVTKAAILGEMDRHQEALDLAVAALSKFPDSRELFNLRVAALTKLDRQKEADALMSERAGAEQGGAANETLVMQALLKAGAKDYDGAAALLQQVLEAAPDNAEVIQRYVQVMMAGEKRDAARAYLATLKPRVKNERTLRLLDVYDISLGVTDPEERFNKLKVIVDAIPDPTTRASELYNLYYDRGDLANAGTALDELEKLKPDSIGVIEYQFRLAMRREQWDRAEKYAARLAAANADQAGGSVFRGDMAMSRGDIERAVREYRAAASTLSTDSTVKVRLAQAMMSLRPPAPEEAEATLREALQNSPQNFMANKLMYLVLEQLERREEGMPYLKQAAKLNPADEYIRARSDYIAEESDPQSGVARREKVRAEKPDDIENLVRLAELYGKLKDSAKAEECYQAAAKIDPANREMARSAGSYYAASRNRVAGEKLMNEYIAAQQERGKVQGQMMLARFYELLGDLTAARDAYVAAQEMVQTAVTIEAERREMQLRVAFNLAEFYYRVQLVKEMIEACRHALTLLDPTDVAGVQRARLRIIEGLLKTRRLGEADEEIAGYLKEFPNETRGLIAQAQLLLAKNQPRAARDSLTRVLQDLPNHDWSLFTRGTINIQLRNYDEARADLLKAKQLSPRGFDLQHRMRLAQLYEQTGKLELAEAELREIQELAVGDQGVASELLRLLTVHKQYDKAGALISEYMARFPQEAYWPMQLGVLMMERKEYGQAVSNFHRAVDLSKGENLAAVAFWLQSLAKSGRGEEAIAAFEQMADALRSPVVRCAAGEAYQAAGRREDADREFSRALADAAGQSFGEVLFCSQRIGGILAADEVRKLLGALVASPPADEYAAQRLQLGLASALLDGARDAAATQEPLRLAEQVMAVSGEQTPERVQALLLRARGLEICNDAEGMLNAYEQILTINDRNIQALNNMAYALADRFNRAQEALVYAQRAAEVGGTNPNVLDTVGWVYFLNDRADEAQTILADALRMAPDNASVHYHMGEVYQKAGRVGEARSAFQRAKELAAEAKNAELTDKIDKALQRTP